MKIFEQLKDKILKRKVGTTITPDMIIIVLSQIQDFTFKDNYTMKKDLGILRYCQFTGLSFEYVEQYMNMKRETICYINEEHPRLAEMIIKKIGYIYEKCNL